MALRALLVSAVIGVAALGALLSPAAQAGGSISISVGTPHHGGGYYGGRYGGYYGGGYGSGYDRGYGGRYYRGGYHGGGHYRDDYRGGYDRGHGAGYVWVPGHWVSTYRGRVFVQGQYVRAQGYGYGYGDHDGYGYDDHGYGRGYDRPVYRNAPLQPLPGGFYYQRGGH